MTKKLLLYGANKYQINNNKETPIDFANKLGNDTMKTYFTGNPLYKIDKIKNKNYATFFTLLFSGCFVIKLFIYEHFWKSYFIDIFSFLSAIFYF